MTTVINGLDPPQVFAARKRRRTVLRTHTIDVLAALEINAEDYRWPSVGARDQIAHSQVTDRLPSPRRQDWCVDWLRAAAHVRQRRDFDDPVRHQPRDRIGI